MCARVFKTRRAALTYLAGAEIRKDDCEILATAQAKSDAQLEVISKEAEVHFLWVHDPWKTLSKTCTSGPTDHGLASIGRMTHLEKVTILASAVTDEGLRHLTRLTRLRRLELGGTKVTDEGVNSLGEALTDCKITRSRSQHWR